MTQQVAGSLKIPIPKISSYIYIYPSDMSPVNSIKCSSSMCQEDIHPLLLLSICHFGKGDGLGFEASPFFLAEYILGGSIVTEKEVPVPREKHTY